MRKSNTQKPPGPLSSGKKRIFFGFTVSLPALVLLGLEILLRVLHYGPNLSLFVTEEISGKKYFVMNPDVKGRYFSRVDFSPNTSNDYFLMPKPQSTYRIFCLGGSTTVGFPYGFIGSFSTFLRDRLQRTFPGRKVEVINLGLTATNSFTVDDIASEIVDYSPDLVIVYDGHNEFYGALGIASQESLGSWRWVVKMQLGLVHTRTYHLVKNTIGWILSLFQNHQRRQDSGTMMERLALGHYIPYASSQYWACLSIFKENLLELESICGSKGVPLILSTQVSNLRDMHPFVSVFSPQITSSKQEEFASHISNALSLEKNEEFDVALSSADSAAVIDPLRADTHYLLGEILDKLDRKQEAREEYVKARDYDQLRFRSSTDFNNAIRALEDHKSVYVSDVEARLSGYCADSIMGREIVLEHLHPNLYGYFLIAKILCQTMREHGLFTPEQEWAIQDTVSDKDLWNSRATTELDEQAAARRIAILTSGWPFKRAPELVAEAPSEDTLGTIAERLVSADVTWEQAHVNAAEFFAAKNAFKNAESEYRSILSQLPLSVSAYLRLAQLFLVEGRRDTAKVILLKSLGLENTFHANRYLGAMALDQGDPIRAVPFLEDAYKLGNSARTRSDAGYLLALAHLRSGQFQTAAGVLKEILTFNPTYKPANDLLQSIKSRN